jgi:hypothetical protein
LIVYTGQTRSRKLIAELASHGIGEMLVRGDPLPPRRTPFVLDNGAYTDWTAKRPFQGTKFLRYVEKLEAAKLEPSWVVLPDIVAGGMRSLAFSFGWMDRLIGWPCYLAVQDGMGRIQVEREIKGARLAGLFVGGTLRWKIATARMWREVAHQNGLRLHVGRVGTYRRVLWAQRIKADSIDSCLPLWSKGHLQKFLHGINGTHPQQEMALAEGGEPA